MKRLFVCLCMVFALLLAPIVHATGLDCPDTDCTLADQSSKEKKQDDDNLKAGHHCCCNHIVDRTPVKTTESLLETSSAFVLTEQPNLSSITVDTLLEPPSLA